MLSRSLIAILITIAACSRDGDYDAPLAKVDSLMDARPDSALYILDTLEASSHGFPKSTLRRWQLLRLMAQNKCDTIFRSDSLHLVLTDYFDRNGTPNERMTAYYLLGRAYVDMGDAPLALKCYLKATECADTTSDQCDWRQLTIIHMQTGLLFYKQYMPNEALESFAEAELTVRRCGDPRLSLNATELKILAYYELSDFSKIDSLTDLVHQGYDEMGETEMASRALATSLYYHVKVGDTVKARKQIDYLLSHVSRETIMNSPNWSSFNSSLGNYLLLIGESDSAETNFRTLLKNDDVLQTKIRACKGLMNVYQRRGVSDSVYKYANAYCEYNDSSNIFNYASQLENIKSMYDYNLKDKKAREAEMERDITKNHNLFLSTALFALALLALCGFFILRNRKDKVVNQKIQEIELLQNIIAQMGEGDCSYNEDKDEFEESDIVKCLKQKVDKKEYASASELGELRAAAVKHLPSFIQTLFNTGYELQSHETDLCVLIKVGFRPSEIAILMNMTPQNITNLRARLNKKMFHADKGARDFDEKIINLSSS